LKSPGYGTLHAEPLKSDSFYFVYIPLN